MRLFTGKNGGAISVFLSLILLPVLLFCGVIVDASRLFASKTVVSAAGDLTMNAALAEYDRNLKDKYGLMAMAHKPDDPETRAKLLTYFQESCNGTKYLHTEKKGEEDLHSIIQLEVEDKDFSITGVENSSLSQYEILKQQIIEYMKFRGPVYMVSDVLDKFKNLPLKNMRKKQKYVKKKSEYGQKISKMGKPLKEAKEKIDDCINEWNQLINLIGNGTPDFVWEYKNKTVFWLGFKSVEKYMLGDTVNIPWEDKIFKLPDDSARVREYLNGDITWTESEFDDKKYADIMAACSVYRQEEYLRFGITEDNGFSEMDIEKFNVLGTTLKKSMNVLQKNYRTSEKEYLKNCKDLQEKIQKTIEHIEATSCEVRKKLDEVTTKYKAAEKVKKEYQSIGNELQINDEIEKNETVKIDLVELEELQKTLEQNEQAMDLMKKDMSRKINDYQSITSKVSCEDINGIQAAYISSLGSEAARNQFLSDREVQWESLTGNNELLNPYDCKFYKNVLSKIQDEKQEDSEQKREREEIRSEAEKNQGTYMDALNVIKNLANARNLNSEKEELETGFSYPEDYPSNGKKTTETDKVTGTVTVKGNEADDNSIVSDSVDRMEMNGIEQLVNSMDELTGDLLEKAYIMEYTSEMFNCFTTGIKSEKESGTSLSGDMLLEHYIQSGEMEYILYGNPNTISNVVFAVSQIFGVRLIINSVYVFLDKEKNQTAGIVASGLSTGAPWLYPIIKYGYLFCCALSQSGADIGNLVSGREVAVIPGQKVTLTYKEYLKIYMLCAMLSSEGEEKLVMRAADCIQLNTKSRLADKYTMVTLKSRVQTSTTFLPKVRAFLGKEKIESKRSILYRSVLAY